MSTKEIGQALLLVSLLLSVAGMVEPTWWSSLIVAVLTVSAFLIWVSSSYRDWRDGHEQGLVDAFEEDKENEKPITFYGQNETLWKCGLDNCHCINDSRYKDAWADD